MNVGRDFVWVSCYERYTGMSDDRAEKILRENATGLVVEPPQFRLGVLRGVPLCHCLMQGNIGPFGVDSVVVVVVVVVPLVLLLEVVVLLLLLLEEAVVVQQQPVEGVPMEEAVSVAEAAEVLRHSSKMYYTG